MSKHHDVCPKCGGQKRKKNRQCAGCRGYGRKRHLMPSGYVRVYVPGHPTAMADGYALEHRYVLHEAGVDLPEGHHVHHINGRSDDNRLENLTVKTPRDHHTDHALERGYVDNQTGRHALRSVRPCETCGSPFMPWKPSGRYCSRSCANRRQLSLLGGYA